MFFFKKHLATFLHVLFSAAFLGVQKYNRYLKLYTGSCKKRILKKQQKGPPKSETGNKIAIGSVDPPWHIPFHDELAEILGRQSGSFSADNP